MRLAPVVTGIGLVAMFSACNAILGNESHYELVGAAGDGAGAEAGGSGGSVSGGKGGAAGSSLSSGGKSAGRGGSGSGTAGRGGAGGTGAQGGSGGTDAAGEGGDDSAGAGTGGGAGAPTCVPVGVEDCFNRIDDDCNGDLDCEDSACAQAECRPAPSGAELGFFAPPGGTCPVGFTAVDLNQGLQASTTCTGCSCVSPTNLLCDSGVYGHGTYPCPSYQFAGQLWNVFNDRCGSLPSDMNLHYYSIRGTSECTPSGTPTAAPASWATSETFCLADQLGGGCGPQMACLPVEAAAQQLCTLDGGGCTVDYATDRGTWYESFDDERTCSACSCGLGTADCSASYIGVYGDGSCSTNAMPLPIVTDQGDACALTFAPQSARIIGDPVPGSGSCAVNSFLSGEATPTDGHQVCCSP